MYTALKATPNGPFRDNKEKEALCERGKILK